MQTNSPKLLLQIIVGLLLGSILGFAFPALAARLDVIALAFVQAIKMIVIPLIFSAVTLGSYRLGSNSRAIGRLALFAFGWFFFATFISSIVGLSLDRIFQPGIGAHPITAGLSVPTFAPVDWQKFFLGMIPSNILAAMSEQKILPTLVFAVLFGLALARIQTTVARPIVTLLEALYEVIFKLTGWIVRLSPLAVFAVAAWLLATQTSELMVALSKLIAVMYLGLIIVVALCLVAIGLMGRPVWATARQMAEPVMIGFATRSSEVALPIHMEKLMGIGIDKRIVSVVVPLGYSFNLDGAALYMVLIITFLAELFGMNLDAAMLATIILTVLIASKGVANVPSGSMVAASGVVASLGLPPEAIAIMVGVDIFLDMGRAAVNVFGNTASAVFVDRFVKLPAET